MLKRFMPVYICIFLFFIAPQIVLSQSNPETLFNQGLSFYQNEDWLKEQLDLLGPKRSAVEIRGEEPLDSDNALLPSHVLQELKPQDPIRCDFLLPDDIDDEG